MFVSYEVNKMVIDLSRFLDSDSTTLSLEGKVKADSINNDKTDFIIVDPIEFKGEIFKVDGEYLIHLNILCKYEGDCDRCLQPTTEIVKSVVSGKLLEKKGQLNEEDEFDEIIYYENDLLDLTEYILSQAVSSQPMKSLCKKNCKGLCPDCGVDLNKEHCDCLAHKIDPRLEKLKDLFPKN